MDWKDTVMPVTDREIVDVINNPRRALQDYLLMQAEITWDKAIREVVEFFIKNCDDYDNWRPVYHFRLSNKVLETKLKEWGI